MPPGMPSAAQARTIQGIPSGASDQEKVLKLHYLHNTSCKLHYLMMMSLLVFAILVNNFHVWREHLPIFACLPICHIYWQIQQT